MPKKPSIIPLILLVVGGAFAINVYSPILREITKSFGITQFQAQLLMSAGLLGTSSVQLLIGFLISLYGVNKSGVFALVFSTLGAISCYIAASEGIFGLLLISTLITIMGLSAGLAIAVALINTNWSEREARNRIAICWTSFGAIPVLGGFLGSWIGEHTYWVDVYWIIIAYPIILLLMFPLWKRRGEKGHTVPFKEAFHGMVKNLKCIHVYTAGFLWAMGVIPFYNFIHLGPYIAAEELSMGLKAYGSYFVLLCIPLTVSGILAFFLAKKMKAVHGATLGALVMLGGTALLYFCPHTVEGIFLSIGVTLLGSSLVVINAISICTIRAPHKPSAGALTGFVCFLTIILSLVISSFLGGGHLDALRQVVVASGVGLILFLTSAYLLRHK